MLQTIAIHQLINQQQVSQTAATLSLGSMVAPLTSRLSLSTAAALIEPIVVLKTNQTILLRARSVELEPVRRTLLARDLSGNRTIRALSKCGHKEVAEILKTKET